MDLDHLVRARHREGDSDFRNPTHFDGDAQDLEIGEAVGGGYQRVVAGLELQDFKGSVCAAAELELLGGVSVAQSDLRPGDCGVMGVPGRARDGSGERALRNCKR